MSLPNLAPPPEEVNTQRPAPWPLWLTAAGLLGAVATLATDRRPEGERNRDDYTVSAADMSALDHLPFPIGGFAGFLCVAALLIAAAVWHRRVDQRFKWSIGAPVVTFGLVAAAGALTLAYGWKGALGNYLHGAMEEGTYDDAGLYSYYVMNDFSPYLGWLPVAVALGGIAWMGFRERLVARGVSGCAALFAIAAFGAVGVTGVPGLPFVSMIGLSIAGIWLSFGRSVAIQGGER
ncbi:hypothetical protein ACLM5J_02950 [Nocardioides sp. Bht2]|uniref:hypothetical protein n=1 Tax=Nocardioides sp. Bht2 TaxID=3392297 RepID=UPI0039B3695E